MKGFASILLLLLAFSGTLLAQKKDWVAPDSAAAVTNPVTASRTVLKTSKQLFREHCVICHGKAGDGKGIAASNDVTPADLASSGVQDQTDGALYWKISTGHERMIAYKAVLTEKQRWGIVHYIRRL